MTNITPSLAEAKAYIYAIDFSMIIDKVIKTKGWKRKDVLQICELYRNFLFLNKKYGDESHQLPPSEEIDEFWHNHILDTRKYALDCDRIFGAYFHHYPYLGMDGKTDMKDLANFFEQTQELHHKEFGNYILHVRTNPLKYCQNLFNLLINK